MQEVATQLQATDELSWAQEREHSAWALGDFSAEAQNKAKRLYDVFTHTLRFWRTDRDA